MAFHPHTAPLDIKLFYGPTSEEGLVNDGSAWVSLHGSWNSDPPVGYSLVRVPMQNVTEGDITNVLPTANSTSQEGYENIFWNTDLTQCPDNCFRPVGIIFDSRGRLWMTSDSTGEVFIISNSTAPGVMGIPGSAPASVVGEPPEGGQ